MSDKYEGSVLRPRLEDDPLCPRGIEHLVDLLGHGDCPEHGGRMIAGCDPHQCQAAAEALGWEGTDHDCGQ